MDERYISDPRTAYFAKEHRRLRDELRALDRIDRGDIRQLVAEERESLKKKMEAVEKQIQDIVGGDLFSEEGANEVIMEVRAGAGGDEASIFARDLADMYKRYATGRGCAFTTVAISGNRTGGFKDAAFRIRGKNVYALLRFETGVHRVQRVPATERSGRVHTSTASVAILPIRKKRAAELRPGDIKMEFSRSGGSGGQNVNKVESAVRVVHLPTGIDARCTEERTQVKNRERALEILAAKVEQERKKKEEGTYGSMRRSQIGTADRSEKIRTYNALQDRVTDHRIKKSWSNIEGIFAGDLEAITGALRESYEKERREKEGDAKES